MLKDQIGLFNDVSKYVVAMILNRESAVDRAKAVQKFINMSQVKIVIMNFEFYSQYEQAQKKGN